MALFKRFRDNSSLKFHCFGLSPQGLQEVKQLVEAHGGKVGEDPYYPIKFIQREKYRTEASPAEKMYDIEFIRTCVVESRLSSLSHFRLGRKAIGDHCVESIFLYGHCYYESVWADIAGVERSPLPRGSPPSSDNDDTDEEYSEEEEDPNNGGPNNEVQNIEVQNIEIQNIEIQNIEVQNIEVQNNQGLNNQGLNNQEPNHQLVIIEGMNIEAMNNEGSGSDTDNENSEDEDPEIDGQNGPLVWYIAR